MKSIYKKIIENIPHYKTFLTLEELDDSSFRLAKTYPDCVELREIGRTRSGHPIQCLKIGNGKSNALVFGCPHPNEPIGTLLIEHFSEQLASNKQLRDELDYTWYIIKVWDADGYKLNKGWIKGPYSITSYAKHFYRPPSELQVEWSFPIDYKDYHFHDTMPESEAMRKLIAEIKPKFTYSLHNSGFGGAYWYVTRDVNKEVYEKLYNTAEVFGVPVHKGNPESSSLHAYAEAIYQADGVDSTYEYYLNNGIEDVPSKIHGGNCSDQFSKAYFNTFTLLTELPYFSDARICDTTPSDYTKRKAFLEMLDYSDEFNKKLVGIINRIKPYSNKNNDFMRAVDSFSNAVYTEVQRKQVLKEESFEKQATVAEKFDCLIVSKFYKLLSLGMLVRAHDDEIDRMLYMDLASERAEILISSKEEVRQMFDVLAEELEDALNYEVIPIKQLVSIQLQCGLLLADYINHQE